MQALKIGSGVITPWREARANWLWQYLAGGAFSYRRRKEQKRIWTGAKIVPSLTFSLGDHFRGCSSIGGGTFTELGPFFPQTDGRGLRINYYSWNKVSNIIFLESPAGVGWSYSNTSTDYSSFGDKETAQDLLAFLLGWLDLFPEYKNTDFYIAGESCAGHYVPQLALVVLAYKGSNG
ncbi:hypothetical protein GOP47_0020036 [Adiantum capillus-veneris]|uniref:Carboxypeptidase n=1 Tax=Adiantum capillus-veneris TaxID=13818 RepID=A0A9D4UDT1_ADICA|nr:hypothetical protein GOP47_0020036 [Adiantum capillus-veneris]